MNFSLFIVILVLMFSRQSAAQQDSTLSLINTIKGNFVSFSVDNLDNIYLLNAGNQLKKLNATGDSVGVFNDIRKFGKVTYIDVSNPLRVLLYYKDFSTVVILDRLLNVRSTIDLRQQNIFQVQAIGLSYDNKIWVFDEFENKLKKIDEDGKLLFETSDFRQLFNETFVPTIIYDNNRLLYLYDKQKGAYVFDYFGTLKNRIAIHNWTNFKVAGQFLFGVRNDSLLRYQPTVLLHQEFLLPASIRNAQKINFTATKLYALKNDGLEIYSLR